MLRLPRGTIPTFGETFVIGGASSTLLGPTYSDERKQTIDKFEHMQCAVVQAVDERTTTCSGDGTGTSSSPHLAARIAPYDGGCNRRFFSSFFPSKVTKRLTARSYAMPSQWNLR